MFFYEFVIELMIYLFFGRIDFFFMVLYYVKYVINLIILFIVSIDFCI